MQLDSFTLNQLVDELDVLVGTRLDRIGQPQKEEIHLSFRQGRDIQRLCISLRKDLPRVHLTAHHPDNLRTAPALCMALRRHLEGARLVNIHAPRWERYFTMAFSARNRLGDLIQLELIIELIPRASNLTLVDAGGKVLISSRYRVGAEYSFPPKQSGIDPEDLSLHRLTVSETDAVWKVLLSSIKGFGPLLAKEAVYRSGLPLHATSLQGRAQDVVQAVHALCRAPKAPAVYYDQDEEAVLWHPTHLTHLGHYEQQTFEHAHQAADAFYYLYLSQQTTRNRKQRMRQVITRESRRRAKKRDRQASDWERAENADDFKLWGELLYAQSPHSVAGARQVEVMNYYTNRPLMIPLDPTLSVKDNAKRYFTRYEKALRTKKKARKALEQTQSELDYLDSLADILNRASSKSEVDEIWEEMQSEGLLGRDSSSPPGDKRRQPFGGVTFTSPQGHTVLLGKNHRQNEQLVRMARPDDVWLHARGVPGAHVLVRTPPAAGQAWPDEKTLLMAAELAAYHSKAAQAQHVEVDWTWAKHVRKPKHGRPGMVIYENEQTLRVTPESYAPSQ